VPVVYCLCNPEKKRACPLCRALFDESDCVKDEALNLTMNVYYRASDEEVEEEKEKRKSRPGRASRIVSGMQRWSHRLGESSMIQDSISAHQDMVALARRSWMF
jgi:hypothetical protein